MLLLISSPKTYAVGRFVTEAEKQGKKVLVLDPADLLRQVEKISPQDFSGVYFRDIFPNRSADALPAVKRLAQRFSQAGKKVIDANAVTGQIAEGKWCDHQKMLGAGIPVPRTEIFDGQIPAFAGPWVLKWEYGMKGRENFLVGEIADAQKISTRQPGHWLLQERVHAQKEYKIVCVGYQAYPSLLVFEHDFSGSRPFLKNPQLLPAENLPAARLAEKSAEVLGRELCKVDILEKDGRFYVLEVNRNPGLRHFEQYSRENIAAAFVRYCFT